MVAENYLTGKKLSIYLMFEGRLDCIKTTFVEVPNGVFPFSFYFFDFFFLLSVISKWVNISALKYQIFILWFIFHPLSYYCNTTTREPYYCHITVILPQGHVVQWFATSAQKPKVPGSSPVANYVQKWALCSNCPANV